MEASSFSAAGAPSTPLWAVGYRLPPYTGLAGERNCTLLRGLYLHTVAPQLTIPTTSPCFLLLVGYSSRFLPIRGGGGYPCTLQPTIQ